MPKRKASDLRESPKQSHTVELAESWRRERPDLNHDEVLLQIYIMRLGRVVEAGHDKLCRANYGVSSADMRLLFALRRVGPPYARRPTDLFRTLLMTSGAITKQVDRLQKAGLVVRKPDPSYGGGFLIKLTERGRRMADDAVATAGSALIAKATANLSERDVKRALRLFETFLIELEPDAAPEAKRASAEPT